MCTIFSLNDSKSAFGGNNEDYSDPHTRLWFIPRKGGKLEDTSWVPGKYARNYCGYRDLFPQGGINEKGLFFDTTACPPLQVKKGHGKPGISEGRLLDTISARCATVEEALNLANEYNLDDLQRTCLFFGDAAGDAAIVEGDETIRKNGHFQVLTNFYQSLVEKPEDITCTRFKIATQMLEKAKNAVNVDTARKVLSAVSQSLGGHTVYSQVYDLKKQIIYLYHFHNFETVRVIDPKEEWEKDTPVLYDIAELFPPTHGHIAYTKKYDFLQGGQKEKAVEEKYRSGAFVSLDSVQLERFTGRWKNDVYDGKHFDIFIRGQKLALDTGNEVLEAHPTSGNTFCILGPDGETSLRFDMGEKDMHAKMILEVAPGWQVPYSKLSG